jgi:hypothetical protein
LWPSYEVDHFIPLGLGGDNVLKNLWLEPETPRPGYLDKDAVETEANRAVCRPKLGMPKLDLARAQYEITTDWVKFGCELGVLQKRAIDCSDEDLSNRWPSV